MFLNLTWPEVAEILNDYFVNITASLEISEVEENLIKTNELSDPTDIDVNMHKHHPSTGWAIKKFPLLKIHSTKTTSRIWIIQILVKSRNIKVFLWLFSVSYQHYKYRLIQLYKYFMVAKWLKNGLKHRSIHKRLLAQNNEGNATSHGWEISSRH